MRHPRKAEVNMDEGEIRAEAERRKQRAKDLGLVEIIFQLYRDHVSHLDENFDHDRSSMPRSLTRVVRTRWSNQWDSVESIELFFGATSIRFVSNECNIPLPDGEVSTSRNILIIVDGKTDFDLRCRCSHDKFIGRKWYAESVEGFIEGPWVNTVKKFAEEVSSLCERRNSRLDQERQREELQKLKDKFGIEL